MFCRPFWLSPRQAVVIPVAPVFDAYALKVSMSVFLHVYNFFMKCVYDCNYCFDNHWLFLWLGSLDDFQVRDELYTAGFMCDADVDDSDTMNKKIRNAQLAQYNFILGVFVTVSLEGSYVKCLKVL